MKKRASVWCENNTEQPPPQQIIKIDPMSLLNNTEAETNSIRMLENTIFFYSDVNSSAASELNRLLTDLEAKLLYTKNSLDGEFTPPIKLRINSNGGSLIDGLAIVDRIRTLRVPVHTYIDGGAASAATIISVVGAKRYIGNYSWMLIHQLSSAYFGNFQQLEDEHNNSKQFMDMIKGIYKKYTKIPMKTLETILQHDLWLSANDCLKFGLVDHIL